MLTEGDKAHDRQSDVPSHWKSAHVSAHARKAKDQAKPHGQFQVMTVDWLE